MAVASISLHPGLQQSRATGVSCFRDSGAAVPPVFTNATTLSGGAAVYYKFSTNYGSLGVKPVDDNKASQYQNSDHAGTPENLNQTL